MLHHINRRCIAIVAQHIINLLLSPMLVPDHLIGKGWRIIGAELIINHHLLIGRRNCLTISAQSPRIK